MSFAAGLTVIFAAVLAYAGFLSTTNLLSRIIIFLGITGAGWIAAFLLASLTPVPTDGSWREVEIMLDRIFWFSVGGAFAGACAGHIVARKRSDGKKEPMQK